MPRWWWNYSDRRTDRSASDGLGDTDEEEDDNDLVSIDVYEAEIILDLSAQDKFPEMDE